MRLWRLIETIRSRESPRPVTVSVFHCRYLRPLSLTAMLIQTCPLVQATGCIQALPLYVGKYGFQACTEPVKKIPVAGHGTQNSMLIEEKNRVKNKKTTQKPEVEDIKK